MRLKEPLPMSVDDSAVTLPNDRKLRLVAAVFALILLVVVIVGVATRAMNNAKLREWTDARAIPTVMTVNPSSIADSSVLRLPGRIEAYSRAPIYARVSGYLKAWYADIGAQVKTGQLLATIETPDLDQQLAQAKGDLASAQANASLAESTHKRWSAMLSTDAVSKQEAEEKAGDLASKQALVNAARANVDRLEALASFKRIVAPFDGVVTSRSTDIGALINAGSNSGPELFTVSSTNRLRVYVSVPQMYAPGVRPGVRASITVPERPGVKFDATVESTSNAVNRESGALLVQLSMDNSKGELLPGSYADVELDVGKQVNAVTIPSSALIFDANGLHVAAVDADNRVVMKPVQIALDQGKTVMIASGLSVSDRVIDSPPDALAQGDRVQVNAASQDDQHARS